MSAETTSLPAPTGVIARYVGQSGGATTRYYWVQAIYPSGSSVLQRSNLLTTQASLDHNNQVYIEWNPMGGALGYNIFYTTTTTAPTQGSILVGVSTAPNFTDQGQSNSGSLGTAAVISGNGGLQCARAQYSGATDGLAQGTITPSLSDTIPKNAIMVGGTINVTTAVTSNGSATVGVGTSAGSSTVAILAATAKGSLTAAALITAVPTFAAPVKMTADGQITVTIGAADLLTGIIEIFVLYYVSIN